MKPFFSMIAEISLPLAIEDYLLVIFFAIGLYFVARTVASECAWCGRLAFIGGGLISLGGSLKVAWKLIIATSGREVAWLNNSLFILMSAGFIYLAWALWRSRKVNTPVVWISVPSLLIVVSLGAATYLAFVSESRAWFFLLLGVTTLFNILVSLQLILRAHTHRIWLSFGLFAFNLLCVLSLAGISDQTVTLQWIKQIVNTLSQSAFAFAGWKLYLGNTAENLE